MVPAQNVASIPGSRSAWGAKSWRLAPSALEGQLFLVKLRFRFWPLFLLSLSLRPSLPISLSCMAWFSHDLFSKENRH